MIGFNICDSIIISVVFVFLIVTWIFFRKECALCTCDIPINVPRDCETTTIPQIVPKRTRDISRIEDILITHFLYFTIKHHALKLWSNRRMLNGMYGGVRGEINLPYTIIVFYSLQFL